MGQNRGKFEITKPDGTKVTIHQRNPQDFKEYKDLPTWVRTAIVMCEITGLSRAEAAKRCGKAASTLGIYYTKSPAAKAWIAELQDIKVDPLKMSEMIFKSNSLGVSLEYFATYEKAIEAGDYQTAAKISQDLLDRAGVTKKKEKSNEKIQVTLNIAGSLDVPEISASYDEVVLEDDEFDVS